MKSLKRFLSTLRFKYLLTKEEQLSFFKKHGMIIGDGCDIQNPYYSLFGSEYNHIQIGNHVTLNSSAKLITHDGSTRVLFGKTSRLLPSVVGKIVVGDNVFIGAQALLLPGVKIGSNSIIAAGAVMTGEYSPNSVLGGNPAKYICSIEDYQTRVLQLPELKQTLSGKKQEMESGKKYLEYFEGVKITDDFFNKINNNNTKT